MPLWTVPQPKLENGIETPPWRTVGGRAFDASRPDDVAWLRRQYEEAHSEMPPPPKPSPLTRLLMWFGVPLMLENPAATAFRERWDRPFEEVAAQAAEEERLVQKYDPDLLAGLPRLAALQTFPEFPAFMLDPAGEAPNLVVAEIGLPYYRLADLLEPPEMSELADEFAHGAADYRAMRGDEDETVRICLHVIETAADWLRFWAERGHPSKGCRFILTPHGRIQVETV